MVSRHTRSSGAGEKSRLLSSEVLSFDGGGHLSIVKVELDGIVAVRKGCEPELQAQGCSATLPAGHVTEPSPRGS